MVMVNKKKLWNMIWILLWSQLGNTITCTYNPNWTWSFYPKRVTDNNKHNIGI